MRKGRVSGTDEGRDASELLQQRGAGEPCVTTGHPVLLLCGSVVRACV